MKRIAGLLILVSSMAIGVVATVASPGASGTEPGRTLHANTLAPSQRPSDVSPMSSGYYEVTPIDGPTSYIQGQTTLEAGGVNGPRPDQSSLTMQLSAGTNVDLSLTLPSGQSIQPGGLYETGDPGVQIFAGSCAAGNGDPIAVEVDQITWATNTSNEFYATSAAIQFTCLSQYGDTMYGAFAYNIVPTTPGQGYYTYESDGTISGFGNDNYLIYLGDLSVTALNEPIVGMAVTPDGGGYYLVASDGGIFSYGDATFYGSTGSIHLNKPIVGMAATPDGKGYWLVASDGGIFSYGDAPFYGSTGSIRLNKPIVGMAATRGGAGYWLVASDGGIFAYGNARFFGSTGNIKLNKPVVGMTPTPDGGGYWFVATDGGIFSYGDAQFYGSTGSISLTEPIVGMAATQSGSGYWLVASDGGIFAFNAPFGGSLGGEGLTDIVGIAT
jgi:hypothetical protein